MDDRSIVELYWQRNENAISETQAKYGRYCFSIAQAILVNKQDAEECVNDTYSSAWNTIPPHRPEVLSTFLGKITRRLSLKTLRKRNTAKRGGEITLVLDELAECIPSDSVENAIQMRELSKIIDNFLSELAENERRIFVCRYWYCENIKQIAKRFGFGQSKVKMTLKRTRDKLLEYLKKEELL